MSVSDTFHANMREALAEAARRKANPAMKDFVTRVEESPYGGLRVRSFPADLYVDQLADSSFIDGGIPVKYMAGA